MKNYKEILNRHGIAPSLQRIKILQYLDDNRIHPTADMIYQALEEEMPTLSKTTVYNTLKAFTEKKILTALSVFENEIRYEYDSNQHIHFKCNICGEIYDVSMTFPSFDADIIDGHKVSEHHVNLRGICRKCLEKGN